MKKKVLTKKCDLDALDTMFSYGDPKVKDVIKYLEDIQKKYGADSTLCLYTDPYDAYHSSFRLTYKEEETDEQFEKRVAANKKRSESMKKKKEQQRLAKIEFDKRLLKELLKKYGPDVEGFK